MKRFLCGGTPDDQPLAASKKGNKTSSLANQSSRPSRAVDPNRSVRISEVDSVSHSPTNRGGEETPQRGVENGQPKLLPSPTRRMSSSNNTAHRSARRSQSPRTELKGFVGNGAALGAGCMAHVSVFLDFSQLLAKERVRPPDEDPPSSVRRFLYAVKQYPIHQAASKRAAKHERNFFWEAGKDLLNIPFINRPSKACTQGHNLLIAFPVCVGGSLDHALKRRRNLASSFGFSPSAFAPRGSITSSYDSREQLETCPVRPPPRFSTVSYPRTSDGDEWSFSPQGLPFAFVAQVAYELLIPIRGMYRCGWQHNDIKPDNIFLDHSGHIVLGDFGLASPWDTDPWHINFSQREVRGGRNLPPPNFCGGCVDLYSYGITLLWLATGQLPFMSKQDGLELREDIVSIETKHRASSAEPRTDDNEDDKQQQQDDDDTKRSIFITTREEREEVWLLFRDLVDFCCTLYETPPPPEEETSDSDDDDGEVTAHKPRRGGAGYGHYTPIDFKSTTPPPKDWKDHKGRRIITPEMVMHHKFFAHPVVTRIVGVDQKRRESLKRNYANDKERAPRLIRLFDEVVAKRRLSVLRIMTPGKMCDPEGSVFGYAPHSVAQNYILNALPTIAMSATANSSQGNSRGSGDRSGGSNNSGATTVSEDPNGTVAASRDAAAASSEYGDSVGPLTDLDVPDFYPCDFRYFACDEWDLSKWDAEKNRATFTARRMQVRRKEDQDKFRNAATLFNPIQCGYGYNTTPNNSPDNTDNTFTGQFCASTTELQTRLDHSDPTSTIVCLTTGEGLTDYGPRYSSRKKAKAATTATTSEVPNEDEPKAKKQAQPAPAECEEEQERAKVGETAEGDVPAE